VLLDIENIGIAVGIVCYHVYKLRYTLFHIYFRFQAAVFDFSLTLTSSCTTHYVIRCKRYADSVDISIYSIWNVSFKCFRFHVRHLDFRLNSDRIVHRAMLLSAAVTSTSSKTNAAKLIEFAPKGDLRPWFNGKLVTNFITLSLKNLPPNLHFRWCNSITGLYYFENLNDISSGFDGSRNVRRNFWRATEIFKKNEGAAAGLFEV